MDLSTIKDLIRNGSISDFQQLGDHYNLMCENAMTYNPTGHWVHNYALELKTFCAKTIQVSCLSACPRLYYSKNLVVF